MNTTKKMTLALLALIIAIIYIVLTFRFRMELGWWAFADCFMLFMAIFSWLMSLVISGMIPNSGRVLSNIAFVLGILFVVSLVGEYITYSVMF